MTHRPIALVTGGAKGIGYACAEQRRCHDCGQHGTAAHRRGGGCPPPPAVAYPRGFRDCPTPEAGSDGE